MRKVLAFIVSNMLIVVIPLIPKPQLIFHPKIIIIVAGSIFLWLTQPAFSVRETKQQKSSDKYSVLIIILMSFISVIVPVSIWAYFKTEKNSFGLLSITGICAITIGLLLRAWSVRQLGKYFTPTVHIQEQHQLITTGPYKYIRHPSYTGAFMAITAGAFVLETWLGYLIAVVAMAIAYNIRIRIEETELNAHFGKEYKTYSENTKKMIPFLW